MIKYSILRVGTIRIAAVLIKKRDFVEPHSSNLIRTIGQRLTLPIMLVSVDESNWTGLRTQADFDVAPFVYQLLNTPDLEWSRLESQAEQSAGGGI